MFIGTSINTSPVIAATAGTVIENGAGKAVKFDANGGIVPCNSGEAAVGFLILQQADQVVAGDTVTVQICGQGKAKAGGTIAAGDLLTVGAVGTVGKATSGDRVVGQALEACAAGGYFNIHIFNGGQLA